MKILVADDMRSFLDLSQAFLKRADCKVLTARTGLEALKVATTHKPDIIVLDIEMPEMNGLEVTRILRENPLTSDTPILIVSASSREPEALMVGANDFLLKPFDETAFLDALQKYAPIKVRKDKRRTFHQSARLTWNEKEYESVIVDVSVSGAFLKTEQKLEVGDLVGLSFTVPLDDQDKSIMAEGIVVRKGSDGYGVTFQKITEGAQLYLKEFVESQPTESS